MRAGARIPAWLLALALAVSSGAVGMATPAQAEPPAPGANTAAGTAVISVKVAGVRNGSTSVSGLEGVILKLHRGGKGNIIGSVVTEGWGTCVSDANGNCDFTIPNTKVGEANYDNRFYIVQDGTQPGTPAADGWYDSDTFGTSTELADPRYTMRTDIQLRAGQTYLSTNFPVTVTGGRSSTGIWAESMENPSLPDSCGLNVALILDLSYSVAQADAEQTLKDAALGLTNSLVGTNSQVALFTFGRNAPATGAVNANRPLTPVSTQAGVSTVDAWISGIEIPAGGNTSGTDHAYPESTNWDQGLYQVAQQQNELADGQKLFDTAIIITDGGPTRYSAAALGNGQDTRFAEVEQAIFSANALKARGTRVIAIGVGDGVTGYEPNLAAISGPDQGSDFYAVGWEQAATTLKSLALSGCVRGPQTASLTVIKQVVPTEAGSPDYAQASPAGGWTVSPTTQTTGASLSATSGVTAIGTGATTFKVGFEATAPAPTAEITVTESPTPASPGSNTFTAVPTPSGTAADCVLKSAAGGVDTAIPLTDPGAAPGSFGVSVQPGQIVSCTIYNQATQAPANVRVDKVWRIGTASAIVEDGGGGWTIDESQLTSYPDGSQPTGFSSSFSVTDNTSPSNPVTYDNLAWGVTYTDWHVGSTGTVTETMSLPAGCSYAPDSVSQPTATLQKTAPGVPGAYPLQSLEITGPGSRNATGYNTFTASGDDDVQTLEPGNNVWTLTNTVVCVTKLVLGKQVLDRADTTNAASPWDWELTATEIPAVPGAEWPTTPYPQCAPGETGSAENPCLPAESDLMIQEAVDVKVGHTYVLSESLRPDASPAASAYAQGLSAAAASLRGDDPNTPEDESSQTSLTDGASGSWWCGQIDEQGEIDSRYANESQFGQITIPYDATAVTGCIAVNATAEIAVMKTIVGTDNTVSTADWTYSLTPVGGSAPQVTAGKFGADEGELGEKYSVLPMQVYTVTENSEADHGYTLTDIRCSWTAPVVDDNNPISAWGESVSYSQSILHPPADSGLNPRELTLYPGTTATCEFINTADTTATLTLVKQLDESSPGSAAITDWTLTATGPTEGVAGKTGDAAITNRSVAHGEYVLTEADGPVFSKNEGSYALRDWVCVNTEDRTQVALPLTDSTPNDGVDNKDTVTIEAEQTVTCTAVNTWNPPVPSIPTGGSVIDSRGWFVAASLCILAGVAMLIVSWRRRRAV